MEGLAIAIELGEPAAGGDPQVARGPIASLAVLRDRHNPIARQAIALAIVRERAGRWVEPIESLTKQADPQHSGTVEVDDVDAIIAKTGRVVGVVPVARDLPGCRIQAIEPTTQRADPDVAAL